MSQIAIIPARGGSERIPGKNAKLFYGKPIITYAIDAAIRSSLFDDIIVSTDSSEIAEISRKAGASVPFKRGSELAGNHAGMAATVIDALEHVANHGKIYDQVCCLFATAAFVTPELLVEGFRILQNESCDSVITVQLNRHPILRSLKIDNNGNLGMVWPDNLRKRSQDLDNTYHDAAQFYWAKTNSLSEQKTFYSTRALPLFLSDYDACDIDTLEDWHQAERLWQLRGDMDRAA